jgi:AcrR family transcriptional regulator
LSDTLVSDGPRGVSRPTVKGLATRQRLLEAASRAFAEYGYERTRVADIVGLAGVSHGNFYRHFKDKDEVLLDLLRPLYKEIRASLASVPVSAERPTEAQLVARYTAFFQVYARHRHLLRVSREAAARGEASSFLNLWLAERQDFIARTARWLTRMGQSGAVMTGIDPDVMAEALGSLTEQMAYVQIGLAKAMPRPEALEAMGRACGRIWFQSVFGAPTR